MHLSLTTLNLALITLTTLLPHLTTSTCYNPNGTAVLNWSSSSIYQPCSNDTSNPLSNICCALNRANPPGGSVDDGFTADICLPSGLCQNILTDQTGQRIYSYWRDYCTGAEWESGKCLRVCTGEGQHADDGTAPLTPCGDTLTATKWCCGTNNTACCSSDDPAQEMQIPVSLGGTIPNVTSTSSGTSSATASSTVTATSTSSPSGTLAPSNNTNDSLSTGAKAGIGIGAAVGGALLIGIAVIFAFCMRRRKGQKHTNPYELETQTTFVEAPGYSDVAGEHYGPSEVDGRGISEMGTEGGKAMKYRQEGRAPVELA